MINHKILSNNEYLLRSVVLKLSYHAGDKAAHVGGALSILSFLSVLNFVELYSSAIDHQSLILSKGHACLALYSLLVFNNVITFEIASNNIFSNRSILLGHPCKNLDLGIMFSTGSLGNGIAHAAGLALARKRNSDPNKVYVILGDGECNEGIVWESFEFIQRENLDNMFIFIDCNGWQQTQASLLSIDNYNSLIKRLKSFSFSVYDIDGHNYTQLHNCMLDQVGAPKVVVARTIKGYGVPSFENNNKWHHSIITKTDLENLI